MEKSALVYILLTAATVAIATLIRNEPYVSDGAGRRFGSYQPPNRDQARNRIAEFAIYCLLAGVSACRIAVGTDYWRYRENFKIIAQNRHVSSEAGFNYVVKALVWLFGYDHYLPIFGLFSIVTVYFFVRTLRDQGKNFAFSLFLLMTGGYYFNSMNSVRYYLALAMAIFSVKYVLRREFGKFLLLVLAAAMFHKSVLVVIPTYLFAFYLADRGIKRWHCMLGGGFLVSLIFGQKFYRFLIFKIYPYYENSHFDDGSISYANVAKCTAVLLLCGIAWFLQRREKTLAGNEPEQGKRTDAMRDRFYLLLTVFGLATFCCGSFVPEVTRIAYYLIVPQIFLIPDAIASMKKGWFRTFCKWGVILAFTGYFAVLLLKMYDSNLGLLPYLSWIFN